MSRIFGRCQAGWILVLCFFFPAISWGQIASMPSVNVSFSEEGTSSWFSLGISTLVEFGDMTYSIKGKQDGGWKSELEWPLDGTLYLGGVGSLRLFEQLTLNVGGWTSVYDKTGTMKDSDWLYGYYGSRKAIYSESDSNVEGTHFDLNVRYDIVRSNNVMAFGVLLGYSYTQWDWTSKNGEQWTIDPEEYFQGSLSGKGMTYQQKIGVPYAGIAFSSSIPNSVIDMNAYGLFSPWATCDDEDDHLLREKLSNGESDGMFWALGGDLRWHITPNWSASLLANYSAYDLEGKQTQYFYGGENAGLGAKGIDLSIEGSQFYFGATAGLTF
ncbi:hypothetical protein U14_01737 [Candidatus Moduliflexus flocculans]|uniref:Omptin family outer membrane protease n=1 Tax=Candidatus Moduliflexus flocculans TaxID=1499966 RepID=A0A0S6VSQ1_9BACT|nr:hypothetical protein U14_01737 [Candidatus Moduliflexus flocculans]